MIAGKIKEFNKIYFFYFFSILIIAASLTCFSFIAVKSVDFYYVTRSTQLIAYVVLGVIALNYIRKLSIPDSLISFRLILILFLSLLFVLSLIYLFIDKTQLLLALSNTAAFTLPFVVFNSHQKYVSVSAGSQQGWILPKDFIANKALVFVNNVPLKFKLTISDNVAKPEIFKTIVPAQMKLGSVFQAFIIQQKNNEVYIEQSKREGNDIAWLFYRETFFGLHHTPLSPGLNVWENNIKPNSVVVVKRRVVDSLYIPKTNKETAYGN